MWDGDYPLAAAWAVGAYFARLRSTHAVYVLSRPRGLPEEMRIGAMADGYGEVWTRRSVPRTCWESRMAEWSPRPSQFAIPNWWIDSCSPTRGVGSAICRPRPVRRHARDRDWAAIRAELAGAMFTDWPAFAYPSLASTIGRSYSPNRQIPTTSRPPSLR
jgi:hypothetical protein